MRRDEGQLVSTGKPKEDQGLRWVFERFDQYLAHALFQRRFVRHRGRAHDGNVKVAATIDLAKTKNTDCHGVIVIIHSAIGAPKTWPALPAVVAMVSDIERLSSLDARPTTARITPSPVPAVPKPTSHA